MDDTLERCRQELRAAWDQCNHLARFEAWADLYYRRYRRLAPGKSDPIADSSSEENRALSEAWHRSGLAAHDAILEVARLRARVEELEEKLESKGD